MNNSLFKWKFQKHNTDSYKIMYMYDNTPLYITSYYSHLKTNPDIKCSTPVMLVKLTNNIILPDITNYLWKIVNKTFQKHSFYITHQEPDKTILYLSCCNETSTLMITTEKYEWNIINMEQMHQVVITDSVEYSIVDSQSTRVLSVLDNKLVLSPSFLWRLVQNPFKHIDDKPFINELYQYNSFFIYTNVNKRDNKSVSNVYLSGEGLSTVNKKEGYTLLGMDVEDDVDCNVDSGAYMCSGNIASKNGIQSLKWNITKNSLVNIFKTPSRFNNNSTHLTYAKKEDVFYLPPTSNSDWDIINLIRKNKFRNNDLIIINTKHNVGNKTLIIDPQKEYNSTTKTYKDFKFIQTNLRTIVKQSHFTDSCMDTKILDLYIGKYNYANDTIKSVSSKITEANILLKQHQFDIDKKHGQLKILQTNIGRKIQEQNSKHFGDSSQDQNTLQTRTAQITDEISKSSKSTMSVKTALNSLNIELNAGIQTRDKWKKIIDDYETECNKEFKNKQNEDEIIGNYINNKLGIPNIEHFDDELQNIKNTLADADTQIKAQNNIIKEKKTILPIRIGMLENITESNNVKRNFIYTTVAVIILLVVIVIILYVRNNKVYINKPEM